MRRPVLALLAGAALTATMSVGAHADAVKLKAASFLPERVVFAKYFYQWAGAVNEKCAGKVEISVVGPAAIASLEQWNALKNGVIDMHYGPANYYKGVMPEGDVFSAAQNDPAEQRANGAWALINQIHNEKLNAWYLTSLSGGVNFFVYTTKPAQGGDFSGFRLRSVPIYDAFFKSLGAQPVRMPPPEVYTALERGAVEGYGWPLWGIGDSGWDKYTKFRYGPGFMSAALPILVNLDKWNSMAEDQRQCLNEMALWAEQEWPNWRNAENATQMAVLEKAGIQYVDLGPEFKSRAEDLYWSDLANANPDFIGKVRPLLTKSN